MSGGSYSESDFWATKATACVEIVEQGELHNADAMSCDCRFLNIFLELKENLSELTYYYIVVVVVVVATTEMMNSTPKRLCMCTHRS